MTQMMTGHEATGYYLCKIGECESEICRWCAPHDPGREKRECWRANRALEKSRAGLKLVGQRISGIMDLESYCLIRWTANEYALRPVV
ncbi:unnamed protein product, partial [Trichogramma brassicae]